MLARRYFVSGDVQGVGFRYFVQRRVHRIGNIRGFVRNLHDGRVEVYAEAEPDHLLELESVLRQGPPGSQVNQVEVYEESASGQYQDFRITFV